MKIANDPAYPCVIKDRQFPNNSELERFSGMTLRQYYAGLAMQGLLSGIMGDSYLHASSKEWFKDISEASVEFSDALIAELENSNELRR